MMEGIEKIIITNNNPNMIYAMFAIMAFFVIIVNLIGIKLKLKRKEQLEEVRKKIIKRHESMETELLRKRREQGNDYVNKSEQGFGFSGRN